MHNRYTTHIDNHQSLSLSLYIYIYTYIHIYVHIWDSLRGSSVKIGTKQRRLAWPLRKDDTHRIVSRSRDFVSNVERTTVWRFDRLGAVSLSCFKA